MNEVHRYRFRDADAVPITIVVKLVALGDFCAQKVFGSCSSK